MVLVVDAHIERAIRARVAEFQNRPSNYPDRTYARTYALAIIVTSVAAWYVLPDEPMHLWMVFVDGAIILAICVLVLEASMLQAQSRLGDLSNVMAWLAVISGACGFVARLFQRAQEGSMTVIWLRTVGLWLVLEVMMGSIALIVFGEKWLKRA